MVQEATKVTSALSIPALCSLGLEGFSTALSCWPKWALGRAADLPAPCLGLRAEVSVRFWWEIPEVLTGQLVWQLAPKKNP